MLLKERILPNIFLINLDLTFDFLWVLEEIYAQYVSFINLLLLQIKYWSGKTDMSRSHVKIHFDLEIIIPFFIA